MATNIEIEAKVLIEKDGFETIKKLYEDYANSAYIQTNYYIDTPDFLLRKNGVGLRIRCFENKYVMTLKTPLSEGLLEKTENITKEEYKAMRDKAIFPENKIKSFIIMLGFEIESLKILTSLTTERIDIAFETGMFSIDRNEYQGKIDYELEKESNNLKSGEDFLVDICTKAGIKFNINKTTKQARAFNRLEELKAK
jgi:uncharacterized protein YjbK